MLLKSFDSNQRPTDGGNMSCATSRASLRCLYPSSGSTPTPLLSSRGPVTIYQHPNQMISVPYIYTGKSGNGSLQNAEHQIHGTVSSPASSPCVYPYQQYPYPYDYPAVVLPSSSVSTTVDGSDNTVNRCPESMESLYPQIGSAGSAKSYCSSYSTNTDTSVPYLPGSLPSFSFLNPSNINMNSINPVIADQQGGGLIYSSPPCMANMGQYNYPPSQSAFQTQFQSNAFTTNMYPPMSASYTSGISGNISGVTSCRQLPRPQTNSSVDYSFPTATTSYNQCPKPEVLTLPVRDCVIQSPSNKAASSPTYSQTKRASPKSCPTRVAKTVSESGIFIKEESEQNVYQKSENPPSMTNTQPNDDASLVVSSPHDATCPEPVNRPKRKYQRRIMTVTDDGAVIKVAVPRIVKSDIRRQYLSMLTNVFNSCDFPFMYSFIHTFAAPNVMLLKQNLYLNKNDSSKNMKRITANSSCSSESTWSSATSAEETSSAPISSSEAFEQVAEQLNPSVVSHWPPYLTGFGPHTPPADYKPILPYHSDQGICVIGRSLVTYYWMSLLQLIPDQVIRFEEVKVVTRAGTGDCYIICKFTADGVQVYDITYHDMLEDLVDALAKKCDLQKNEKEKKQADTGKMRKRRKTSMDACEGADMPSMPTYESDGEATAASHSSSSSESSGGSSSTSATTASSSSSSSIGSINDNVNVQKDTESDDEEEGLEGELDLQDGDEVIDVLKSFDPAVDEDAMLSLASSDKCPKDPAHYHDLVAERVKHSKQPVEMKGSPVQIRGLFCIHINEDRQIRTMDFRLAFPSGPTSASGQTSTGSDGTDGDAQSK